jgi:hypothetical protein
MAPCSRVVYPILQCPLGVRERLCTTSEPHSFANVVPALLAPFTGLARLPYLERNFVTNIETRHFRAHAHDYTRGLVAQRHGFLDNDVAIAVVAVVMQI